MANAVVMCCVIIALDVTYWTVRRCFVRQKTAKLSWSHVPRTENMKYEWYECVIWYDMYLRWMVTKQTLDQGLVDNRE